MAEPDEDLLRTAIVAACRQFGPLGLATGTSGNVSVRAGGRMLISPSATPYEEMTPGSIAATSLAGPAPDWQGPLPPSTEWPFHFDILRARHEVGAIVHTHSPHATALACARRPIPACHYMVAAFGGTDVRCAPYATFGTAALSRHALDALEDRMGCLLANHGAITLGETLEKAMWRAVELETLARQYLLAEAAGGAVLLGDDEIAETLRGFANYGVRANPGD